MAEQKPLLNVLCCLGCELPDDQPNGIGNAAASLMVSLHEMGYRTFILAKRNKAGPRQGYKGIPTYRFARQRNGILMFIRIVLRFKPDIIYAHGPSSIPWPSLILLRILKLVSFSHTLFIFHDHGAFPEQIRKVRRIFSGFLGRVVCRRPDCVVTVSETQRRLLLRHGLSDWTIGIVRNSTIPPLQNCRKELLESELPVLLSVGRMTQAKGLHIIAQALPELIRHLGPCLWLHVGWRSSQPRAAEYHSRLVDLLDGSGIYGMTQFTGDMEHNMVLNLYRKATFFVHPSLHEGFGLTILEAMAASTPVVVSNIPSCRDLVTCYCGSFFKQMDPISLSHAIIQDFRDLSESKKRGRRAVRRSRLFSPRRSGAQLARVIERLTEP